MPLFLPSHFEQKLQRLQVPLRLGEIPAPGVEPMPADQESVRVRVLGQHRLDPRRRGGPVLGVLENGQPFAVLVRCATPSRPFSISYPWMARPSPRRPPKELCSKSNGYATPPRLRAPALSPGGDSPRPRAGRSPPTTLPRPSISRMSPADEGALVDPAGRDGEAQRVATRSPR